MSSSTANTFDTNGLEKVQYKTTTTDEDGVTETKILTIFFEEEIKDKVPTEGMLDGSWHLVSEEEKSNDTDELKKQNEQIAANQAKLAFQSPIPTISKLSISSKMPPTTLLVAKTA
eukprot:CAMPEP_0116133626 /NCGR_PEP_ID=MMETSP0329-20121206/10208_1 /TAXON_ID=697910 /ORGANISM="Pseudo-nitzschia arenysensis, Strain B593" /LENGTH=115 /DNA_ID=CAMNT_0003628273 /DNA_START=73 /DNA_END=420 /DNA_ORIENTATION=+